MLSGFLPASASSKMVCLPEVTMRRFFVLLLLVPALLIAQPQSPLTGRWIFSADFYGSPIVYMLELQQQGDKLTGKLGGDKLEGAVTSNSLHFLAKDEEGGSEDCKATIQGGTMT